MNTIGERLKKLRKHLLLSQLSFSEKIGIKRDMLSKYENNITNPSIELVNRIHTEYNLNISWLLTGTGDMLEEKEIQTEKPTETTKDKTESEERKEITDRFLVSIDYILKNCDIDSRSEIARKMGISTSLLTEIAKGRSLVTPKRVLELTKAFPYLNKEYIQSGKGEIILIENPEMHLHPGEMKVFQKDISEIEIASLKSELKNKDAMIETLNELINSKNELINTLKDQLDVFRTNQSNNKQTG